MLLHAYRQLVEHLVKLHDHNIPEKGNAQEFVHIIGTLVKIV